MPEYEHLTRDELLNLAQERTELSDEARVAFDSELARRNIGTDEISGYARETLAQEKAVERQAIRSKYSYEGRNKKFIGKRNRKIDARERVEEFDTTLWLVFLVPLIPLASYRLRRRYQRSWGLCPRRLHVIEKHPRDWDQILRTWLATAAIILILYFVLPFVIRIRFA
jgi:hypothetical protein